MRMLHTSDWHLGRTIRSRPRTEEFVAVLDELIRIAQDERVEAVLVAGDIFDSRSPVAEAEELFLDTCLRLHDLGVSLVAIAGNHDSPARLQAWRHVLSRLGVHLVPQVTPPSEGSLVEIAGRDGSESALVACIPFVAERRFGSAAELFDAPESWYTSYADGVGHLLAAMSEPFRSDRVNVAMAHLFTDGALLGSGERTATVGLEYAVSPARLPATASYVALGHVHRPQVVRGAPAPARFAGSLLQLDFGEAQQAKSVTIIEASPGVPIETREVPVRAGRELRDVTGSLENLTARAEEFGDAYLRVFLEVEGPTPGIADQVREVLPNALDVHLTYERTSVEPSSIGVRSLSPQEQFAEWHQRTHGAPASPELLMAFDEVLGMVTEAE
jgi:exonuclease SbcD